MAAQRKRKFVALTSERRIRNREKLFLAYQTILEHDDDDKDPYLYPTTAAFVLDFQDFKDYLSNSDVYAHMIDIIDRLQARRLYLEGGISAEYQSYEAKGKDYGLPHQILAVRLLHFFYQVQPLDKLRYSAELQKTWFELTNTYPNESRFLHKVCDSQCPEWVSKTPEARAMTCLDEKEHEKQVHAFLMKDFREIQDELELENFSGFIPAIVKPFMELKRQERLIRDDWEKCKQEYRRLGDLVADSTTTGGQIEVEEAEIFKDIALQFAILRSHNIKLVSMEEAQQKELKVLGMDEFVEGLVLRHNGSIRSYTGFRKQKKMELYGKLTSVGSDDDIFAYEGEFAENEFQGIGYSIRPKSIRGVAYRGHWKNGKFNGKGALFYSSDKYHYYYGDWRDDQRHGKGIMTYGSSYHSYFHKTYVGGWVDDQRSGRCTITGRDVEADPDDNDDEEESEESSEEEDL